MKSQSNICWHFCIPSIHATSSNVPLHFTSSQIYIFLVITKKLCQSRNPSYEVTQKVKFWQVFCTAEVEHFLLVKPCMWRLLMKFMLFHSLLHNDDNNSGKKANKTVSYPAQKTVQCSFAWTIQCHIFDHILKHWCSILTGHNNIADCQLIVCAQKLWHSKQGWAQPLWVLCPHQHFHLTVWFAWLHHHKQLMNCQMCQQSLWPFPSKVNNTRKTHLPLTNLPRFSAHKCPS